MTEEEKIMATLEEYAAAYCAKDTSRLMAIFVKRDDVSLIGTGTDELCRGSDEIQAVFNRNFTEATATQFEWHWKQVTIVNDTAMVAITMTIHLESNGSPLKVPVRWSVGLTKIQGAWLWLHRHASVASGSQESGTAYPAQD
jgi:uncharacterized protein (TIGR02246 family)